MNTIKDGWDSFADVKLPKAPEIVLTETQVAYYSGAERVLHIMWDIGDQNLSEDAGTAILVSLADECREFAREYGRRRGLPIGLIDAIAAGQRSQKGETN